MKSNAILFCTIVSAFLSTASMAKDFANRIIGIASKGTTATKTVVRVTMADPIPSLQPGAKIDIKLKDKEIKTDASSYPGHVVFSLDEEQVTQLEAALEAQNRKELGAGIPVILTSTVTVTYLNVLSSYTDVTDSAGRGGKSLIATLEFPVPPIQISNMVTFEFGTQVYQGTLSKTNGKNQAKFSLSADAFKAFSEAAKTPLTVSLYVNEL